MQNPISAVVFFVSCKGMGWDEWKDRLGWSVRMKSADRLLKTKYKEKTLSTMTGCVEFMLETQSIAQYMYTIGYV